MVASEDKVPPLPQLDKLPEEIVSNISHRLDHDDVSAFRLVCRSLESKSYHEWATEYFNAKCFMFTTESLSVLLAIANNERLRLHLHKLHIATTSVSDLPYGRTSSCRCNSHITTRHSQADHFYLADQKRLKESGGDESMLLQAFRQLTEVTTLFVVDYFAAEQAVGSVYGLRKMARRTGRLYPTSTHQCYAGQTAHVWKCTCQALAASGLSTIRRFGIEIDFLTNGHLVHPDLAPGSSMRQGLRTALSNLEKLHLMLGGKQRNMAPGDSSRIMTNFATTVGSPTEVVLYGTISASNKAYKGFMAGLDVSRLKSLRLETFDVPEKTLTRTLKTIGHIKNLEMNSINITTGSWIPVLRTLQAMLQLEHLHLRFVQERERKVYFLKQKEPADRDEWPDDEEDDDDFTNYHDDNDDYYFDHDPSTLNAHAAAPQSSHHDSSNTYPPSSLAEFSSAWKKESEQHMAAAQAAQNKTPGDIPTPEEEERTFTAPGFEDFPERGYYVCLRGREELAKYLPRFIAEYNLGDDISDDMFPLPQLFAGPPVLDTVVMGTTFAGPPLPGLGIGVGAGTGAGAATASGPGTGTGAGTAAGAGAGTSAAAGGAGGNSAAGGHALFDSLINSIFMGGNPPPGSMGVYTFGPHGGVGNTQSGAQHGSSAGAPQAGHGAGPAHGGHASGSAQHPAAREEDGMNLSD